MSSLLRLLEHLGLGQEHHMNRDGLFVLHDKIREFLGKNPTSFFEVWNLLIGWRDEYYKDNMGLPDGFGLSPPHILLGCLLMDKGGAEIFCNSKGDCTFAYQRVREPPTKDIDEFHEVLLRHEGGQDSFPKFDPGCYPFQNPLGDPREIFENPLGALNEIFENPLGSLNEILQNPLGALNEIFENMERQEQCPKRPQPVRRKRPCGDISGQGTHEQQGTPEQKMPKRESSILNSVVHRLGVWTPPGLKPCDQGSASKVSRQGDGSD